MPVELDEQSTFCASRVKLIESVKKYFGPLENFVALPFHLNFFLSFMQILNQKRKEDGD